MSEEMIANSTIIHRNTDIHRGKARRHRLAKPYPDTTPILTFGNKWMSGISQTKNNSKIKAMAK